MEINNIYDKHFIYYEHNVNFSVFKTVILLDTMRLSILNISPVYQF